MKSFDLKTLASLAGMSEEDFLKGIEELEELNILKKRSVGQNVTTLKLNDVVFRKEFWT